MPQKVVVDLYTFVSMLCNNNQKYSHCQELFLTVVVSKIKIYSFKVSLDVCKLNYYDYREHNVKQAK